MKVLDQAKQAMTEYGIPSHMHGALTRYIEQGLQPGSFLTAVINNDLRGAIERADDMNKHALFAYVKWLYNFAPAGSWGFPGAIQKYQQTLEEFNHVRDRRDGRAVSSES